MHLLQGVVGDDSNFFLAEAFDGMKDEDLAVGPPASRSASCTSLMSSWRAANLLGIAGVTVGDEVFFEQLVVGLMELEPRLVAGLHVRLAMAMLERDFADVRRRRRRRGRWPRSPAGRARARS